MRFRPVVLVIMDGLGIPPHSALRQSPFVLAARPNLRDIESHYPLTALQASGVAVGLPPGEPGNSEVGHLTIGAGRAIWQHLPRIIASIRDGTFFTIDAVTAAIARAQNGKTLHIAGMLSSGSVHAYREHLEALVDAAGRAGVRTRLHLFADGKDAPMREFASMLAELSAFIMSRGYTDIAVGSVSGRNFAMDRDARWARTKETYLAMRALSGEHFRYASAYAAACYKRGLDDADIPPAYAVDEAGRAVGHIESGDALFFFNFREDSMRQITTAFAAPTFEAFVRPPLTGIAITTMTAYDPALPVAVAFPPLHVEFPLARVIADEGLSQCHIAESEKYAHVTYFLNGGREAPFEGEERVLVPSPVSGDYEGLPGMSAAAVADAASKAIGAYDVIVVNFANPDMVGHTGNAEATVRAIDAMDQALGRVVGATLAVGGALLITSDHGNAEMKRYGITGLRRTKHSAHVVPCAVVAGPFRRETPRTADMIRALYDDPKGVLTDVAPTVLELCGLVKPGYMTGVSLLTRLTSEHAPSPIIHHL